MEQKSQKDAVVAGLDQRLKDKEKLAATLGGQLADINQNIATKTEQQNELQQNIENFGKQSDQLTAKIGGNQQKIDTNKIRIAELDKLIEEKGGNDKDRFVNSLVKQMKSQKKLTTHAEVVEFKKRFKGQNLMTAEQTAMGHKDTRDLKLKRLIKMRKGPMNLSVKEPN